jgi:hypothetical protein
VAQSSRIAPGAVTITGDMYCRSTDKDYSIDTPESLAFITPFMP